jgi:hypothetical protein
MIIFYIKWYLFSILGTIAWLLDSSGQNQRTFENQTIWILCICFGPFEYQASLVFGYSPYSLYWGLNHSPHVSFFFSIVQSLVLSRAKLQPTLSSTFGVFILVFHFSLWFVATSGQWSSPPELSSLWSHSGLKYVFGRMPWDSKIEFDFLFKYLKLKKKLKIWLTRNVNWLPEYFTN